jgi:phospholipid transport system substrate-binding protein
MIKKLLSAVALSASIASATAPAAELGPEEFVRTISSEVIEAARADRAIQAGDIRQVKALVDTKVVPHVDFEAATRSAVGPKWREATAEQRERLQTEFKTLLMLLYAGALTQVRDQTIEVIAAQGVQGGRQVIVRSLVRGKGEPIRLDYRLGDAGGNWKILDINVGGIWLVTSYRSQFAQELGKGGLEGLINALAERNKRAAKG